MICFPPVGLATVTHTCFYLFEEAWRLLREAAASRIYFAVALGDLSARSRARDPAASVANEVVSSQPPRAGVRVSAAADA